MYCHSKCTQEQHHGFTQASTKGIGYSYHPLYRGGSGIKEVLRYHYRSALWKEVPGGRSVCWQRCEVAICPREAQKKFFACIFSDEEALS